MTEEITPDVFAHLVDLAALELDPQEAEYIRQQLNNQLKAIHELAAIPLDESLPITAHGVPYDEGNSQSPRADRWAACPNPDEILEQAPQFEDGYIIVPDIPHTALE
jgi:aspartyl-tRNA(Asn)/glutamyl-tRNA(Gln) amidotransferase subunit C